MAAFAAGLVVAAAAPAEAYVRTSTSLGAPMFWNRTVLEITAYVADPPPPLTSEDILTAVRAAAATWSRGQVACTSLDLRVTSTELPTARVELDGLSRLTFRRVNWCREPRPADEPCYDPQALAVTSVFARKDDGQILDADVELNALTFSWADLVKDGPQGSRTEDLQNTLTHEFGHFIGLDHTCFLNGVRSAAVDDQGQPVLSCAHASDAVKMTTMFAAVIPGDTDRRTLSADDQQAVCDVYPALTPLLEGSSGCTIAARAGGRRPLSAAGLVGVGLIVLWRRRRASPPGPASRSSTDRPPPR